MALDVGKQDTNRLILALLLRILADEDEDEERRKPDGRETEPDEMLVRPRIEPLGGG